MCGTCEAILTGKFLGWTCICERGQNENSELLRTRSLSILGVHGVYHNGMCLNVRNVGILTSHESGPIKSAQSD